MQLLGFLVLGLFLFLGGLKLMSVGLEALGGTSFGQAIRYYTGSRLSAFLCGLIFTALTQSSSLATVIVVGVVDAGIIGLTAAIAVIIGANVGTTVTGQLLAFHLYEWALPIAIGGMSLFLCGKEKGKQGGKSLLGLGVLLFGLKTVGTALEPIAALPWFAHFMQMAAMHPLLGVATGAAATAVIQSSSAVVGMTLALAKEGTLSLAAGAAVIVGADVGTCVTSLLAGMGAKTTAKQAAVAHLLFNVCSVMLVLPVFPHFIRIAENSATSLPRQLANAHTLYNLSGALILLILLSPFEKLVQTLINAENPKKKRISAVFGELIGKWFN